MYCGIVIADIDPAGPSGKACGLRKLRFDPGRALERGSEGEFGLRSGKIDPARPSGKACGLRKLRFDPERG